MAWDKISRYATSVQTNPLRVVYHSTCIVEVKGDEIILCSGGWETVTTKRKMNQAAREFGLGYSVYAVKGIWYVDAGNLVKVPFVDGMCIHR
jgi:hypothetical protein